MSFDLKGRAHTKGTPSFRSASRHSRHEDEKTVSVEMGAIAAGAGARTAGPISAVKMLLYAAATANEELVTRALKNGAHINDVDSGPDESDLQNMGEVDSKTPEEKESKGVEEKVAKTDEAKDNEERENGVEEKKAEVKSESGEVKESVYKSYVYTGDAAIHRAAAAGHAAMIKFLWINNADLEVKNRIGSTALHRAVSNNQLESVVQLLQLQARVDSVNNIGNTPLHCAVYNGNVEIARLLVDGGAWTTLNSANKANMTPVHYARKRPMIQLLEQYLKQYHLAAASFSRLPTHLLKDLHGILPSSSFHGAQSFHKSRNAPGTSAALPPLPHPHSVSTAAAATLSEEKSSSSSSGNGSAALGPSSTSTHSFSKHKKKVTLAAETIIKEEDEDNASNAV